MKIKTGYAPFKFTVSRGFGEDVKYLKVYQFIPENPVEEEILQKMSNQDLTATLEKDTFLNGIGRVKCLEMTNIQGFKDPHYTFGWGRRCSGCPLSDKDPNKDRYSDSRYQGGGGFGP